MQYVLVAFSCLLSVAVKRSWCCGWRRPRWQVLCGVRKTLGHFTEFRSCIIDGLMRDCISAQHAATHESDGTRECMESESQHGGEKRRGGATGSKEGCSGWRWRYAAEVYPKHRQRGGLCRGCKLGHLHRCSQRILKPVRPRWRSPRRPPRLVSTVELGMHDASQCSQKIAEASRENPLISLLSWCLPPSNSEQALSLPHERRCCHKIWH